MASPSPGCPPLAGNPDLYGLGVRIGLYAQWTATLTTSVLHPADESALRLLNLIVQAAIFIGLCTESSRHASAAGALITQILLCGSLSSVTGDGVVHFGHASGFLRLLFYVALSAYGIWFWFVGLPLMLRPGCDGAVVAFFGPSYIDGWVRSLGKAVSVAGLVAGVALVAFGVYSIQRRFRNGLSDAFARPARRRPQVEIVLMLLSMVLLGLSIATVEYLIRANDIQGVGVDQIGSVAQLIPLLAGVLACFLSFWQVLTRGLLFRRRCWFFLGRHL